MKIFIVPRPHLGDFVLCLYSDATEYMPSVSIQSKMAKLPADSPAFATCENPEHSWFYHGDDAREVYDSAEITMGKTTTSVYERDYEAIREEHPDRNLKPYWELTDEERGRHFHSYMDMDMVQGFQAIGESIRNS